MKIVSLVENTASRDDLAAEHGLSLYIETHGYRILFDAGQSGAFADNGKKLGIDLRTVDFAVLSHGHYDHGGGMSRFLELNSVAPVYLSPYAFEEHHNRNGKFIGLNPNLAESDRLRFVDGCIQLGPGITVVDQVPCVYPIEAYGLTMGRGIPEDFRHEIYLLIEDNGQRICISGCSHRGILNIMEYFRPDILVGGFHFKDMDADAPGLELAAAKLASFPTTYYTGHCTGQRQMEKLKPILGTRLLPLSAGFVYVF